MKGAICTPTFCRAMSSVAHLAYRGDFDSEIRACFTGGDRGRLHDVFWNRHGFLCKRRWRELSLSAEHKGPGGREAPQGPIGLIGRGWRRLDET